MKLPRLYLSSAQSLQVQLVTDALRQNQLNLSLLSDISH